MKDNKEIKECYRKVFTNSKLRAAVNEDFINSIVETGERYFNQVTVLNLLIEELQNVKKEIQKELDKIQEQEDKELYQYEYKELVKYMEKKEENYKMLLSDEYYKAFIYGYFTGVLGMSPIRITFILDYFKSDKVKAALKKHFNVV